MNTWIGSRAWTAAGVLMSAMILISCGGGGSDQLAGIDRLGVSSGSVSGFGSIFVNGVEYETDPGTEFEIDDAGGSEDDLDVGDVVTVEWSSSDGKTYRAERVSYDDTLEGPIASIDAVSGTLVVLGQAVLVDASTSFDAGIVPASVAGLAVGQFVEISGFIDGDGNIRASRIERVTAGSDELEVRGVIEGLDTLNETFVISGLTVDYSGVVDPPVLENGDFVEAEGGSTGANGELLATALELEDEGLSGGEAGEEAEIEGFVTRYVSATDFDVAGVPVTTDSGTDYEGGSAADLALNVKIEVDGKLNASGVLVAEEVSFRDGGGSGDEVDVEIAATVDSVSASAGTLLVLGITVTVDEFTRIEDQSDAEERPFGLANLRGGDAVEIRGVAQDDGSVRATQLEREDPLDRDRLRGAVDSVGSQSLVILGVTVDTDGNTVYRDSDDNSIAASAFFAAVSIGSEVKASGSETGATSLLAGELELED